MAQISSVEKNLVTKIDKRKKAAELLLKKIVNINSGTMNFEGVKNVGEVLMNELKVLGFEVRWAPGESFNRAGNLIASHVGKKGRKILLIGHLDTVFEPDSPFQTWEMLNDSIIHGPGVSDMKGGDVIILLALQALNDANLLDDMNLEVVFSGDEESSGTPIELSKKDLIETAKLCDFALCYEDGDGNPNKALVSRRGSSDWTLTVKGRAAHSSQLFTSEVGTGAIFESARILNDFYLQLNKLENLTFNPGIIIGGNSASYDPKTNTGTAFGKNNIVSQDVIIKGDLRAVSTPQLLEARKKMTEIVASNYPQTNARIVFGEGAYPPMSGNKGNFDLLKIYNQVSLDLGFGPQEAVKPRDAGAADICFVNDFVKMALDGLGLAGSDGHTIREKANLNYLPIEAKRSAVLLYRLSAIE